MHDIQSRDELERFLGDLTSRDHAVRYRSVWLELFHAGPGRGLFTFISTLLDSLLWRLGGGQRRGVHVRVRLPVPVAADLLLEFRSPPATDDDPLRAHFIWSASSERRMRSYVEGVLLETLIRLRDRYALRMTDRQIEIGPLLRSPATSAADIDALLEALPRPPATEQETEPLEGEPDPVVVGSTSSRMEADLWRSLLEAADVPFHVRGYDHSPPWGSATPMVTISLLVPASAERQAREILAQAGEAGALSFCYNCGASLPEGAEWCPECRVKLESDSTEPPEKL